MENTFTKPYIWVLNTKTMIDIKALVKDTDKTLDDVANALYPTNRFPLKALKRVIDKKTQLKDYQIVRLAELFNVSIDDLFKNNTWKVSPKDPFTFTKLDYTAKLETSENIYIIRMYDKDQTLLETLYTHPKTTLSEFIHLLNKTHADRISNR